MAYAIQVNGEILVDTVYEHEELAKMHWLAYSSGDYAPEDFYLVPDGLTPSIEFAKYPEASTVRVAVRAQEGK